MTFFDCTADLVGQLNGNGQNGMLQIDAPAVENFWLRHCPARLEAGVKKVARIVFAEWRQWVSGSAHPFLLTLTHTQCRERPRYVNTDSNRPHLALLAVWQHGT